MEDTSDPVPESLADKITAMYKIIDNVGIEIKKYKNLALESSSKNDLQMKEYEKLYGATRGYFIEVESTVTVNALKNALSEAWDQDENFKVTGEQGVVSCHYGKQRTVGNSPSLMFCTHGGISKFKGSRPYQIYNYIPLDKSPLSNATEDVLNLTPLAVTHTATKKRNIEWSEKAIRPLINSWNGNKPYFVMYLTENSMGQSANILKRFPATTNIDAVASYCTAVKFLIRLFLLVSDGILPTADPFWVAWLNLEKTGSTEYGYFIKNVTDKTSGDLTKDFTAKQVPADIKNIIKKIPLSPEFPTTEVYDITEKLQELYNHNWELFWTKNNKNQNAATFSALHFLMMDKKEGKSHYKIQNYEDIPNNITIIRSTGNDQRCYFFVSPLSLNHANVEPSYIISILFSKIGEIKDNMLAALENQVNNIKRKTKRAKQRRAKKVSEALSSR
tara:strand:+ start:2328 stop:3665 length:1338 start_codon:yes stop_codon:yes gene_type:complete